MFLTSEEVRELTGRTRKSSQIAQLRIMGIPFFVNAGGHPVVTRSAIEITRPAAHETQWVPAALRKAA